MVAYFVMSHVNATQVERLVRRLASAPDAVVFVRHDGTHHPLPRDQFAGLTNVYVADARGAVGWGSFDQVQSVLDGIDGALASGVPFDWMVLISGQDYPCTDLGAFHERLAAARVDGFLDHVPAAHRKLGRENADRYYFRYHPVAPRWHALTARLWRLNGLQPFVRFNHTRAGSSIGVTDRRAFKRRQLYRGSFWWTLSRQCVEELATVAHTQPELVAAYKQRLHPDESFVQTVLLGNPLFHFSNDDLRYLRWDDPASGSPAVLRTADVPAILASRKPFARKFDTRVDAGVLDAIDEAVAAGKVPFPMTTIAADAPGTSIPRLSIGMPVYNGENYVADAIRSILDQTYTDFELIVSDNASTDATPEIVEAFAAIDPRVRFVRNARNMGASYNFNRTFELARGEYFRQAAHDDTLAPTCLEKCIAVLDADPAVALAYTQSQCIDEADRHMCDYTDVMDFRQDDPADRFAAHLRRAFDRRPEKTRGSNPACNPIFGIARASMLRTTPMVANYIASDLILLGEIALHGKIVEVPEMLFTIRAHPTTSWAQNPSIVDIAAWFDPANRNRMISYMPHLRWFNEYAAAIRRVPMTKRQRRECIGLLVSWATSHARDFIHESISVGIRFCGLRAWNGAAVRRFGPPGVPG